MNHIELSRPSGQNDFLFRAVFIFPKTNKHGMELTDRGINHMNHAGWTVDRLGKITHFAQTVFVLRKNTYRPDPLIQN